jgi:hypothetical protein
MLTKRHCRLSLPVTAFMVCAALMGFPFLILFAWMAEQELLGTHLVSSICHSVNIDEPLDWLYRTMFQ